MWARLFYRLCSSKRLTLPSLVSCLLMVPKWDWTKKQKMKTELHLPVIVVHQCLLYRLTFPSSFSTVSSHRVYCAMEGGLWRLSGNWKKGILCMCQLQSASSLVFLKETLPQPAYTSALPMCVCTEDINEQQLQVRTTLFSMQFKFTPSLITTLSSMLF